MRGQPFGMRERHRGRADPKLVRFMKSSTDRPEAKRARRPVGSTWFGPAT
jgi:hypothetical protein